jgi:glycosyltransferase involved in cell wall biosynthesis
MPEKLCKVCPCPEHGFDSCPWTSGVHRHASDIVCGMIGSGDARWVGETIRQAQRDAGLPGTYGRRVEPPGVPPAGGKKEPGIIRLGLVMPCARIGGAERWSEAIAEALTCDGMRWVGCAVIDPSGSASPGERIGESMPIYPGEDGLRHLAPYCDVLISWGVPSIVSLTAHSSARRILVCHGLGRFDVDAVRESAHAETLVGVSRDARFSFPPSQRERVIVVPNTVRFQTPPELRQNSAVDKRTGRSSETAENKVNANQLSLNCPSTTPQLLRRSPPISSDLRPEHLNRIRHEARERWGVREGYKVLGWLGRISVEKCPEVFVRTVKYLPADWVGVMVGPNPDGITDYIAREGLQDRVRAIGAVEDVENSLPGFDALLVPSEREGDCLAAKEAMWLGVPVLMRPTGVASMIPEAVRSINARGPEEIAGIVVEDWKSGDGRLRAEWVQGMARRRWNPGVFASRWRKIVRRTAEGTAKPGIFQVMQARIELCPHRGPRKPGATCGCAAYCDLGKGRDGHVSIRDCQDCKLAEEAKMDEEKDGGYRLPEMPPKTIKVVMDDPLAPSSEESRAAMEMVMGYDPGSKEGDRTVVSRPLRVGFIMGCCYRGGSEIWTRNLAGALDKSRFNVVGVGVGKTPHFNREVFDSFEPSCPIAYGNEACATLAANCDVLISWGVEPELLKSMVGEAKCRLILVSHGHFPWDSRVGLDVSGVVAVSQAAWDALPDDVKPIATVIPNGVNPERCVSDMKTRVAVRRQLGIRHNQRMVLSLGRIDKQKRPDVVVDAAKRLQEESPGKYRFVMVGDGLDRDSIMEYAARTYADVLFVAGTDQVAPYLAAADCLLQPSSRESDSLSIMEAWIAEVPVISTPVGRFAGRREFQDRAFLFCDAYPSDYRVSRMIMDVFDDDEARLTVVRNAHDYAMRECTAKAMADRWAAYLPAPGPGAGNKD